MPSEIFASVIFESLPGSLLHRTSPTGLLAGELLSPFRPFDKKFVTLAGKSMSRMVCYRDECEKTGKLRIGRRKLINSSRSSVSQHEAGVIFVDGYLYGEVR